MSTLDDLKLQLDDLDKQAAQTVAAQEAVAVSVAASQAALEAEQAAETTLAEDQSLQRSKVGSLITAIRATYGPEDVTKALNSPKAQVPTLPKCHR